jgi:hypothetical protein
MDREHKIPRVDSIDIKNLKEERTVPFYDEQMIQEFINSFANKDKVGINIEVKFNDKWYNNRVVK